jgi:hemerythrin
MALIEWQEDFCTGIPGVDHEHKQLIDEVNNVYAMIDQKTDKDQVVDSLGDIYGSIAAHFALEEQMMQRYGYDEFEHHKADHDRLLDEIREITDEFEASTELNEQEFKQKLNDWFQLHFKTFDSRLHKLTDMDPHEQVEESFMRHLMQQAKNTLFGRTH